jgi:FkbM family methyltransferase
LVRNSNPPSGRSSLVSLFGQIASRAINGKTKEDVVRLLEATSVFVSKGIKPESQLLQDLWVVSQHGLYPGYFLDIGAGHPINISNTWILQSQFGWKGIVFEPNAEFSLLHSQIRRSEEVETLKFAVTPLKQDFMKYKSDGEYSGNPDNFPGELHSERNKRRASIPTEEVQATTLREIIETRQLSRIDYISLDIEGGEIDLLKSFPFDICQVHLISVEHNFRAVDIREIDLFLERQNFRKSLESETEWDAFYVNQDWVES